jgi:hypothetical protein
MADWYLIGIMCAILPFYFFAKQASDELVSIDPEFADNSPIELALCVTALASLFWPLTLLAVIWDILTYKEDQ